MLLVLARLLTLPILIVALAGLLLFGYGVIFYLGRLLFFRRPVFEMGPEGFVDRTSAVGAGFVPWEEVESVVPGAFEAHPNMTILTIQVKNEEKLLERQNPVKRFIMRINRKYFTGAAINVSLVGLPISERRMLAEIKPHLNPTAQRLLAEFQPHEEAGGATGGITDSGSTPARTALRITRAIRRGVVLFVLSMVYYMITAGLVGLGVAFTWNSLGPGQASELAHPVAGVILLLPGILWFIFFPRLIKKMTGREPISSPYGGF